MPNLPSLKSTVTEQRHLTANMIHAVGLVVIFIARVYASPVALPQGVTAAVAPTGSAPPGCTASYPGVFGIAVMNISSSKTPEKLRGRQGGGTLRYVSDGSTPRKQGSRRAAAKNEVASQFALTNPGLHGSPGLSDRRRPGPSRNAHSYHDAYIPDLRRTNSESRRHFSACLGTRLHACVSHTHRHCNRCSFYNSQ